MSSRRKVEEQWSRAKRRAALYWQQVGAGGLLVVLTVVVAAGVVVFLPAFLVDRDLADRRLDAEAKEELTAAELLKAKDDARKTVLQGLGGAALLVGAFLTYRTIQVNREGQITERFTRAIDQLGTTKLDVRLGSIYALERIAKDSKDDHGPVMEVLTAFLRGHSRFEQLAEEPMSSRAEKRLRADLQAATTVIARRNAKNDPRDPPRRRLDLRQVDLSGGNLHRANLEYADLEGADLRHANLLFINLANAWLKGADLREAILVGANFEHAYLAGANLQGLELSNSNLEGANLHDANLEGATAMLGAVFKSADLTAANLCGASLRGAILRGANLQGARASKDTLWPDDFDPVAAGVVIQTGSSDEPSK